MRLTDGRIGEHSVDLTVERGRISRIEPSSGTVGDVDLGGRWVIPGLWDQHVHFTQWAMTSRRIDVAAAESAAEASHIVRAARGIEAGMLVGAGFRDALWPDIPTVELLDRIVGDLAVVLVSADLHTVWANSAGLAATGADPSTTGLLREDAAFAVEERLTDLPSATVDRWAADAAADAARRGVVGIVDLEMAWNVDVWRRRAAAGHDLLRVEFGIYPDDLDRAVAQGLRTGDEIAPNIRVGPLKVLVDGSMGTRTAYTVDAYSDGGFGMLTVVPDRLRELLSTASRSGIAPTVHAIGDRANSIVLDAFAELGIRGRVEHAQLLSRSDIARFAELGVDVSVQPEHAMDDREIADRVWAGRTDRLYPFRSLLDAGATLRFGSDAPVSALDPWRGIAAAVFRTRDERDPWHPEQRISVAEALAASTRSTVEVGQPADLAVVESDPFAASALGLRDMHVAATVLGGRLTHSGL